MADGLVTDSGSKEANEKHPKKGGKLGKYKWYIVGGLAVIAVLVFYFTRSSNANNSASTTGSSTGDSGAAAGVDPSTGLPYASEYGMGGIGATGPAGPAGATGPAGPKGATGKTGKQGKPGKPAPKKKPVKPKKSNPAVVHATPQVHPALRLAGAHRSNTAKAVRTTPRRAA